jgi:nucleoside-diphosphate-sugar epimerase
VYRAFGALNAGTESDPVPLDESSPVRTERYPYRGKIPKLDDYEKLDVEDRYLWRGATILRLPMVYGEHDPQRREEPVLRRIRAGRTRLPIGPGNWLWSRGYVGEIARGVRLAVEQPNAAGEIVNLAESTTVTMRAWFEQIVAAADATLELVTVPDAVVPLDLQLTAAVRQHLLFNPTKAQLLLGWTHADPRQTVARSVHWHLTHPPERPDEDFAADDAALAAARPNGDTTDHADGS